MSVLHLLAEIALLAAATLLSLYVGVFVAAGIVDTIWPEKQRCRWIIGAVGFLSAAAVPLALAAEGGGPGRQTLALVEIEGEGVTDGSGDGFRLSRWCGGADEGQRWLALQPLEVAIPVLALLAEIDGVEQVRGGLPYAPAAKSAEIRNGQAFDRLLRQEEVADGGMGGVGELLQLAEGGAGGFAFPFGEAGEMVSQVVQAEAGAVAGPVEEGGLYVDTHRDGWAHSWANNLIRRDNPC